MKSLPITVTPKLNRKDTVRFLNQLFNEQDKKEIICLSTSVKEAREKRNAIERLRGEPCHTRMNTHVD